MVVTSAPAADGSTKAFSVDNADDARELGVRIEKCAQHALWCIGAGYSNNVHEVFHIVFLSDPLAFALVSLLPLYIGVLMILGQNAILLNLHTVEGAALWRKELCAADFVRKAWKAAKLREEQPANLRPPLTYAPIAKALLNYLGERAGSGGLGPLTDTAGFMPRFEALLPEEGGTVKVGGEEMLVSRMDMFWLIFSCRKTDWTQSPTSEPLAQLIGALCDEQHIDPRLLNAAYAADFAAYKASEAGQGWLMEEEGDGSADAPDENKCTDRRNLSELRTHLEINSTPNAYLLPAGTSAEKILEDPYIFFSLVCHLVGTSWEVLLLEARNDHVSRMDAAGLKGKLPEGVDVPDAFYYRDALTRLAVYIFSCVLCGGSWETGVRVTSLLATASNKRPPSSHGKEKSQRPKKARGAGRQGPGSARRRSESSGGEGERSGSDEDDDDEAPLLTNTAVSIRGARGGGSRDVRPAEDTGVSVDEGGSSRMVVPTAVMMGPGSVTYKLHAQRQKEGSELEERIRVLKLSIMNKIWPSPPVSPNVVEALFTTDGLDGGLLAGGIVQLTKICNSLVHRFTMGKRQEVLKALGVMHQPCFCDSEECESTRLCMEKKMLAAKDEADMITFDALAVGLAATYSDTLKMMR